MPEGYASRRNVSCNTDFELDCGKTWGAFHACCPLDTYCPPNQSSTKCWKTPTVPQEKRCANSTWNLYYASDFFCCDQGLKAFKWVSSGFVGCADPTYALDDGLVQLSVVASGTVPQPSTASTTSTSLPGSSISPSASTLTSTPASESTQTIGPTPSATSSPSSGTNIGAIAGGVVGGVAGVAIIAGLIWYFLLRQYRTSQNNGSATPLYGLQASPQDGRKWDSYPHEIGNNSNEHQAAELPAHPSP
ncbi:hypothetical protein CNMCM5623_000472 [Aspergillus felis]|uniref:Uncharacterized protein n=1 Tax=Aspergillus felis TaxID=1287682 RepID=A0A8H6Q713_9EURO|nr:hypothetical protein CNMCM5623_000472 [Aspergillus felis]